MSLCICADAPESSLLADAISCTGSHHTFLSFLAGDDKADRIEKLKSCRHLSHHLNYRSMRVGIGLTYLFVCLCLLLYVPVNSYGHYGTVSSPIQAFSWASLTVLRAQTCTFARN